jgi:hypothetical protein
MSKSTRHIAFEGQTTRKRVNGPVLAGDWRRRKGTKTDAHLFAGSGHHPFDQRPMCGKAIRHLSTEPATLWTGEPRSRSDALWALPCTACLVQAITRRGLAVPNRPVAPLTESEHRLMDGNR